MMRIYIYIYIYIYSIHLSDCLSKQKRWESHRQFVDAVKQKKKSFQSLMAIKSSKWGWDESDYGK